MQVLNTLVVKFRLHCSLPRTAPITQLNRMPFGYQVIFRSKTLLQFHSKILPRCRDKFGIVSKLSNTIFFFIFVSKYFITVRMLTSLYKVLLILCTPTSFSLQIVDAKILKITSVSTRKQYYRRISCSCVVSKYLKWQ